jgi:hypothetical protein
MPRPIEYCPDCGSQLSGTHRRHNGICKDCWGFSWHTNYELGVKLRELEEEVRHTGNSIHFAASDYAKGKLDLALQIANDKKCTVREVIAFKFA